MKINTTLALLFAAVLLFSACSKSSKEQASGLRKYENGWPTFSFSYPANWVIKPTRVGRGEVFAADGPVGIPSVRASVSPNQPAPLKYFSRTVLPVLSTMGENFEILEDKAVTLKDGTEAWETRLNWDVNNGPSVSTLFLAAKKDNMWISVSISTLKGTLNEELIAIPYSLAVYPGKEEPVAMPEEIGQCIDGYVNAITSHDVPKIMSFFSDDYSKGGATKADIETFYRTNIGQVTSCEIVTTKCKQEDDKTFIAGYMVINGNKVPFPGDYLAKNVNGRWLWVGTD